MLPANLRLPAGALDDDRRGHWKFGFTVAILSGSMKRCRPLDDCSGLPHEAQSHSDMMGIVIPGDHGLNGAISLMCERPDEFWTIK